MSKYRVCTNNVQEPKYPAGIDLLADINIDILHEVKDSRKTMHFYLDKLAKEVHSLTELLERRLPRT